MGRRFRVWQKLKLGLIPIFFLTGCFRGGPRKNPAGVDLSLPTVYHSATLSPIPSDTPTITSTLRPTQTVPPTKTSPPTRTPTPTKTFTITPTQPFSCPQAPPSGIEIDDSARVTFTDGRPLRVRSSPEVREDNIIARLPEGTLIKIFEGPICAENPEMESDFIFWYIKVKASGLRGWVAEGELKMYYIEKYP
jgi:hypothetical protein